MANKSKWMVTAKRADFNLIARECGISPILARLIRNRDVVGVEETRRFLKGTTKDLHDPRMLPDAEKAVDILCQKIEEGGKIRIIGDYDVDGICSSYILVRGLQKCGAAADAVLPERLRDGYGVNERLVREAHEDGAELIVTCDNGIAASEPLRIAGELGMSVIVTDHHEVPFKAQEDGTRIYQLPPANAVVDPKIPPELTGGTEYPFREICGAVVAYKICLLLAERVFGGRDKAQYRELAAFSQFGSELDADTRERLAQGERIREMLKQPQYKPMPVEYQLIIIYAATKKYLLDVAVEDILRFEEELFDFVKTKYPEIPESIKNEQVINDETEEKLIKAIKEFKENFK